MAEEQPKAPVPMWDGRLSYSSFSEYMSCHRKYYLRKVLKTQIDEDATVDTLAFRFGKAFHALLEDCKHDLTGMKQSTIERKCYDFELNPEEHAPHLFALLRHYKRILSKTKLVPTHFEVEVLTPEFRGYVDVILKDPEGDGWWIGDMKTAASYGNNVNAKLNTDWQLNLYAKHVKEIADKTGYLVENFKGCRYLLNVKSKIKRKATDDFRSYAERLDASIESFDIPVPKEKMSPDDVYAMFKMSLAGINALHKSKPALAAKQAVPNFGSCYSYFKPCEYWSKCHGGTFSELNSREVVKSV